MKTKTKRDRYFSVKVLLEVGGAAEQLQAKEYNIKKISDFLKDHPESTWVSGLILLKV